jgi:hypothetical protein
LAAGSCSLYEAVDRFTAHPQSHDPVWLAMLCRTYPRLSDRQCLAVTLAANALVISKTPEMGHILRTQLTDGFAIPGEEMTRLGLGQP